MSQQEISVSLHPHFGCQARIEPNVRPTLTHFEVPRNGVQKPLHSYAGAPHHVSVPRSRYLSECWHIRTGPIANNAVFRIRAWTSEAIPRGCASLGWAYRGGVKLGENCADNCRCLACSCSKAWTDIVSGLSLLCMSNEKEKQRKLSVSISQHLSIASSSYVGHAQYVMVFKIQSKPFWLATNAQYTE